MNIEDIHRVANRKRLVEDLSKVQEKVTKENVELIKLQVAQDTAYWELKEKLSQVKGDHERLQQNMLELQMQYETLSGRHQDELRHRPETLNKLSATRKICEVLEELTEQCKQTSSRTKADQAALYDAYMKSDKVVRDLKQSHLQVKEQSSQVIQELKSKLQLLSEHQSQMKEVYCGAQRRADAEILELKSALHGKDELAATVNELKRSLDVTKIDLEKRDANILNLQRELKNMANAVNSQLAEAKSILMKKDNDLKNAAEQLESLKKALTNQEDFTKSVCDQNSSLQDKLALIEEEHQKALVTNESFKADLEKMTCMCEKLNNNMAILRGENEALIKDVNNKRETLTLYEEELESFKKQLLDADMKIDRITSDLSNTTEQCVMKTARIEKLEAEIETLNKNLTDSETALINNREATEEKEKKLAAIIQEKNNELDSKTSTIIQASFDLQTVKEEHAKLQMELQKMKRDWEMEMENAREKERMLKARVSQCEAAIRGKDEELSREMTKFLQERNEMEKEKNVLQEKIRGLEKRINNIMKEASNARGEPARFEPEPEDVAVMLTPQGTQDHKKNGSPILQTPQRNNSLEDMLFDYFSEPSVDSLDTVNMQRQFAALSHGQRMLPEPEALANLKRRRRPDTPVHGQAASLSKPANDVFTAPQPKNKERRFFKNFRPTPITKGVDKPKKRK
ncbi:putative protein tag-278 [Pararge aegeria]|uniref:putative protein tag-278 n=1 Tax=Pararge aegeria TaxID=116150 RepID=UPI0019D21CFC|nr:putative protein tag-278 [Pararge aegeria]